MQHSPESAMLKDAAEAELLELLLPQVARFIEREIRSEEIDREGHIPLHVRQAAGALGLFGLTIPEEFGGSGMSMKAAGRVVVELARADRSVAIMIGLHAGLGTRSLVENGSEALRNEWLPKLASGECIASFCATESGAGSDLTSIRTVGEVVEGGLRVTGEKAYVTNGGFAGLYTMLVRTPGLGGERAHSLVCIPAGSKGLEVGAEEHKLGIKGSSTVTIRLDGVFVPNANIIGTPGKGMDHAHQVLAWGRTLMSYGCVGTARAALDATLGHVTFRRQFGRSIGDFGATRVHVAQMAARTYAMEALVDHIAEIYEQGQHIEGISSIAKVFCSEGAFDVSDQAVQLHGALGFIEETGVARLLRDCRITRIFEGANDVLLVRIGAARAASREGEDLPPVSAAGVAELEGAAQAAEAFRGRFIKAVAEARARLGIGIVRQQLVLQRIARAEIALRGATYAVLRATKDATPAAYALASHAVTTMVPEGDNWLLSLQRAESDEKLATVLSDALYAPMRSARESERPRRAGAVPAVVQPTS